MPRCPNCGSAHIVVSVRRQRRGHCFKCDFQWGLDGAAVPGGQSASESREAGPMAAPE